MDIEQEVATTLAGGKTPCSTVKYNKVIPAQAGIQLINGLDSGFRRKDKVVTVLRGPRGMPLSI